MANHRHLASKLRMEHEQRHVIGRKVMQSCDQVIMCVTM